MMGNRVEWANAGTVDVSRAYRGELVGEYAATEEVALVLDLGGSTAVIEGSRNDLRDMLTNALYLVEVAQSPQWLVTFDFGDGVTARASFVAGTADHAEERAHVWLATCDEVGVVPAGFEVDRPWVIASVEPLLAGDR